MTKKLISTFILLASLSSHAQVCKVSLADKIYTVSNAEVKYTTKSCNRSQIEIINEILSNINGNLNLHHSRELKLNDIELITKNTVFIDLEDSIKNQYSIPSNWKIKFNSRNRVKAISTDSLSSVDISCNDCKKLGKNKVKVSVNDSVKWFEIEVLKPITAVVAKKELGLSYKSINSSSVEEKTIYTSDDKSIFKDFKQVSFYKTNKIISPGEVIKKRDLSPINLVTYGVPVKITLDSNGIKLTGTATPLSTGKLQDFIKVRNTKTKKVFTAKIIGLNEVKVEL